MKRALKRCFRHVFGKSRFSISSSEGELWKSQAYFNDKTAEHGRRHAAAARVAETPHDFL
jgi:hypothetical protein